MKDCPCKGCNNRFVGCHGECSKYIEWHEENNAALRKSYVKRYMDTIAFTKKKTRRSKS